MGEAQQDLKLDADKTRVASHAQDNRPNIIQHYYSATSYKQQGFVVRCPQVVVLNDVKDCEDEDLLFSLLKDRYVT